MIRIRRRLFVASIVATGASTAFATTLEILPDRALVDRSAVVAAVTVEAPLAVVGERPATLWQVVVDRVLKGEINSGRIVVRLPGGVRPDGLALRIYGTPELAPGRQAILFLRERGDETYALADFPQGAFLGARTDRRRLALRDFSEVKIVGAGRVGTREPMRDFDRFADWIEDRADGFVRSPDYVVHPRQSELQSITSPFSFFEVDGRNLRWTAFDSGGTVTYRTHGSMPNLSGGGATELQRGLAVWTNEPTTPVNLRFGGGTAASGGLDGDDGENVIHWTDPNDEVATFDCGAGGGTIAIGGPWYNPASNVTFNGKLFYRIVEGDVVFADGIECKRFSSPNFSKFIEEVVGHEVGHTLGLGHSSERRNEPNSTLKQALMYAFAHDDGRGARLNSDDIGGLQTLYRVGGPTTGGGGGGGGKPPSGGCPAGTPPDTLCLLNGRFHVTATWQNQFNGTSGQAGVIRYTDVAGFLHFGDASNIELIVKILDFGTQFKFFYSQLTNLRFTISVTDTQTGARKSYGNTAGDCGAIDGNAFPSSSSATDSLSAGVQELSAALCSPGTNTLCLQGGRFSATASWRNQYTGESGVAQAAAITNVTGGLFFLDRANLELLVKAIDFGTYYLLIYGSLSDFEFELTVTDHLTGRTRTYRNPAGNFCGGLDGETFTK